MMESHLDFVSDPTALKATEEANARIKHMEAGGWSMVQCQLVHNHDGVFMYSIVYQRINTKGEKGNAVQIQSTAGIPVRE